jgi:two-component system, OmpR family, sensor histidine kinase KdpD
VTATVPPGEAGPVPSPSPLPRGLVTVLLLPGLATFAGYFVFAWLGLADVVMLYMLAIAVAATQFGQGATLLASFLSVLSLDFCFIEPRYTFVLTDIKHITTFVFMIAVGWVICDLSERIRAQARQAEERERHTRALYRLGAVLAEGGSVAAIRDRVEAYLRKELERPLAILLRDAKGRLETRTEDPLPGPGERELAESALTLGLPTGLGTGLRPEAPWMMLPLYGMERIVGVLAVRTSAAPSPGDPATLLSPLASQISLALERASLAEERTEARIRVEHEQLRNTLLSSISHDLRTPLGAIIGATSSLLNPGPEAGPEDRAVFLGAIRLESERLLRIVSNLLEITKLESGPMALKREWSAIEEVVGSALGQLEERLDTRPLEVDLPEIWVPLDPVLFEQAVLNLLDNALKFTPPGGAIGIRGWADGPQFHFQVTDEGPGFRPGEEERVFEKLYRGEGQASTPGAGLGLAICKGIAEAHGGTIQAGNRPTGGAEIIMTLPLEGPFLESMPPVLNAEP